MPTNLLRNQTGKPGQAKSASARPASQPGGGARVMRATFGGVVVHVALHDGRTADRLWAALPLFSTAEPWGEVVHFEIPVEVGRDRTARLNALAGEVYLWAEENRLIFPFGATPISRAGEIRLPRPCNVLGTAREDLMILRSVRVGDKVSLERVAGDQD